MQLHLQFGHGMMDLSRTLIQRWGQGTVILSPRDLSVEQITRFSREINNLGGQTLLDPQFYDPRSNHHRLVGYNYWPQDLVTSVLSGGQALRQLMISLKQLNDETLTQKYIIPGVYCGRADDDWFTVQGMLINSAVEIFNDKPVLATICLSGDVLRFEEHVETVINQSEHWNVSGYYIVPEHPNGRYLIDDPNWLSNLLILCSGLKLQGREVIVGYCNHQLLALSAANVDAIASGTWLNVRSFPPGKFRQQDEDSTSRRAIWYYCPQSLSEYKVPFLDMAYRAQILDQLRPNPAIRSSDADVLFSGAQPSSTAYSEPSSFKHYLQCLHSQAAWIKRNSFRETFDANVQLIDEARRNIIEFHRRGVRGQDRDFSDCLDVNTAALSALEASRGFVLERIW